MQGEVLNFALQLYKKGRKMNYAGIARQIEIAASPYFFGLNQITLEIIGGILFLLGIFGFFIIEKHNLFS